MTAKELRENGKRQRVPSQIDKLLELHRSVVHVNSIFVEQVERVKYI